MPPTELSALEQWFELAKDIGAGATFVLGPMAWLFWKRMNADDTYIREMNKTSIDTLNTLTATINNMAIETDSKYEKVAECIRQLTDLIRSDMERRRG